MNSHRTSWNFLKGKLDHFQRTAAKVPWLVHAAEKLRNQAEAIIGYSLADSPNPDANGETLLLASLKTQITRFVDVGANVGDWSNRLVACFAPHAAGLLIEPNPQAAKHLYARFSGNPRLKVLEVALSDKEGKAKFFQEPTCGEASSLVPGASNANAIAIDVTIRTLDEVLAGESWSGADFVKIDAEGHDFNILVGCTHLLEQHALRFIQFEYGGAWAANGSTLGQAVRFLSKFGYETRVVTPLGPNPYEYENFREFFRYCNFVAAPPAEFSKLDCIRQA